MSCILEEGKEGGRGRGRARERGGDRRARGREMKREKPEEKGEGAHTNFNHRGSGTSITDGASEHPHPLRQGHSATCGRVERVRINSRSVV